MSDQNYVLKICDAFSDRSEGGHRVVEIGPGPGALTRVLYPRYPKMTAIEIDQRAVAFLGQKLPGLQVCTPYHTLSHSILPPPRNRPSFPFQLPCTSQVSTLFLTISKTLSLSQ